jgi:hypothetical protein
VIWLASRVVVGGGRENVVRLTLTAIGLAAATLMLLCAAVAVPALQNHDDRRGWMNTSFANRQPAQPEDATDPLLWRLIETRFDGRTVVRVDVAAEGPDPPLPPGLDEVPGDGELAVSPTLRELLARTDPAMFADRFPGEIIAIVGDEALVAPDDLVVFVGHSPQELRGEPQVVRVRSIEAAPFTRTLTRAMRLAVAVGGVGLLAPVMVFVTTATRLGAARRERRLAAMRLAGATGRQVGVIAGVEAVVAAVAGTVAGLGAFFAIRPPLAEIPFDGSRFFASDLHLSWASAAAVMVTVPVLAAGTAVVSMRRATATPLGVARDIPRPRHSWHPLLLVAAGTGTLVAVQATMTGASDVAVASAVAAALGAIIGGIVLSGPWLTSVIAGALARLGRSPTTLLAARRLEANPSAGFRAIGGLTLAVFVGTVFSTFTGSVLADGPDNTSDDGQPAVVTSALFPTLPETAEQVFVDDSPRRAPGQPPNFDAPGLTADEVRHVVDGLRGVPGVQQVATAHALPDNLLDRVIRSDGGLAAEAAAMPCSDATAVGLDTCTGTTVVAVSDSIRATGVDITDALPETALLDRPVVGFAAVTDGTLRAVEGARTHLEQAIPERAALTQADHDAKNQSTARNTQRISDIALAITLVIAGCSVAVAVASSIVERRRSFALLRLAGTRLPDLHRVVLTEAATPLLVVSLATAGLGMGVTALTLASDPQSPPFTVPAPAYWAALAGGLAGALAVVAATLPLLNRLTAPRSVRFE